ncbi:hypothetical protein QJQ45_011788 [Haematococcus lacustris]|nr:hypothetical protein QJQ45_011788 [Haematococcus lacustris]
MSVDGGSYGESVGSPGPTQGSRFGPAPPTARHPLPSSGVALLPHELDRSFSCVRASLRLLCHDAKLAYGEGGVEEILSELPTRAGAVFADGFVPQAVEAAYSRSHAALSSEERADPSRCISLFLDLVRRDLYEPVLLPEQVEGIRLGDMGERGRTESPKSLHARMAPQLLLMELGRSQAVRMFLNALHPHPRHVLHDQGKRLVERSMAAYARTPRPVEDSVELALARAEVAATGVYEEFIGMLQLGRVASKPAAREPTSHTAADILTQLKGGDPAAVKTAQRLMRQLHTALTAHGTPAATPTAPPKQWCEHHQRYTNHSTADCHMHQQQAASSQPPPPPAASLTATPAEQAMFEQFKAFMSSRSGVAAVPMRAHTPMQSRSAPPRPRPHCDHCGKDGHTAERCFAKHPELRPPSWGPPATSHSLLTTPSAALAAIDEGMEDDDAAMHSFTTVPTANASQARLAMQRALAAAAAAAPADAVQPVPPPITSPQEAYNAMRHALAGTVVRPLGFVPGSAVARAAPATSSSSTGTTVAMQPPRLPLADITNTRVQGLEAQVSSMQQQVLIMQAQLAQLHAERPLAQAVAAATASSTPSTQPAPASAPQPTVALHAAPAAPHRPASTLPALPFAANPCVTAGFSVLDRHGNPHAMTGVMIDSGSGAQLMTAAVARQLQLEVLPSQLRIIQSGGAEFRTVGAAVVEVGLALGTPHAARSRHRFQVVADSSSLPYSLLVGTEIIHRHGIQLDLPGRLLTYAPRLASHGQPHPRHALPLHFEAPAAWSSGTLLSQSSVVASSCVSSISHSSTSTCGSIESTAPPPAPAPGPATAPAAFNHAFVHRALPYAYNLSVAAGLSVRGSNGKLWAPSGVLFDSGSGALLISQGLVDLLRLPVNPYHLPVLQSGGIAFNTVGHVMLEVGLAIGTAHAARSCHRFYVVASNQLPYSLLIGTELMHQHGVQIDLRARTFTYSPQLASLGQPHPRHALPLLFDSGSFPHDHPVSASARADPLYACVACPAQCKGEQGGSGQAGVCYLGAPGVEPLVTSTTPGCSPAPSVAEVNPVPEIRGLARGPRSKPGHGTARPQLPARSPKHQALGLGAARRRTRQQQRATATPPAGGSGWATAGQELLTTIRKGCTLRTVTTLLLILCALLPTLHACPPNKLPAVPALPDAYSCVTIEHTLPGGQEHLPPDVRFTKHSKGMLFGNHPGMTPAEHAALQRLVEAHDSAFSYSLSDLPGYHGPRPPFNIPLTSDQPVRTPPRRYSPLERQICSDKTAELQAAGIVSPVEGPCSYAAAPVLPAKKDVHGQWTEKRFAIDYRQLNAVTKPDIYGLPRPDEMFSELGDSCFFSKLDMRSGFFQLIIAPADRIKTAFWCGNKLYQFNRMPFGLRNAPAEYQRVMDRCIADATLTHCCKAYIDDLLIHSTSAEQHLADVAAALRMLEANGLKAHPDKSIFGADVVEYLGHNVSSHGLSPTEAKVAAVTALPTPTNLHDLRQIMGFINYYRCYVPNFSATAAPITRLTSKGVPWDWGEQQQHAFAALKAAICTPGLVLRRADYSRPFVLHTDWSTAGCGAVLGQLHTGKLVRIFVILGG